MERSVALLETIIKQISSSSDKKSREFEKEKLQAELKSTDEKLGELVEEKQEHLKKTIQSFGSVVTRVQTCRSKIKLLQEKLARCRTLLHCNRADLKVHWQEGLECSEKLNLLDKIEKAVAVPEQLDRYMAKKHFLHAAELLVETVDDLDGNISNVDALRDLRASLQTRKATLHEVIIDELNKQIYSENDKMNRKSAPADGDATALFKRTFLASKTVMKTGVNDDIPLYSYDELYEDLQKEAEENVPMFMYIMVKSLAVLGKIPEVIEAFKGRIKRDMLMIIRRATDQVSKRAIEAGKAVSAEELSLRPDPKILLELLEVTFFKFRNIVHNHSILLTALEQVKIAGNRTEEVELYSLNGIWSNIQSVIKEMLEPYLDIQNLSTPQQTLSSFGASDSVVASFFTAKKRLNTSNKQKRSQLFKFECSSSSEAIHSYMREQDIASAIPEDSYADYIVWNAPQLLCKPQANNITAVFVPVMDFINEIDQQTSSKLGTNGVLHHFVTNFVEKVFLDQVLYEVSEKTRTSSKGHETLRNLVEIGVEKDFIYTRPILKSTIDIHRIMEELYGLMKKLPNYCNGFLEIVIRTLTEYYESCNANYKGLISRDGDSKSSRIISANWVKDEDIKRLLFSLPNWKKITSPTITIEEKDEGILKIEKSMQEKETSLLIGNLEKTEIEKNQVILDSLDLKAIANLQESLDWLHEQICSFVTNIAAQSTSIKVSSSDEIEDDFMRQQIESVGEDSIRAMQKLGQFFKELAESCLLLLHLEIRCHCFYFLGKAIRESSFVCQIGDVEVDIQIPLLVKDLRDIQDLCLTALDSSKARYLFDGLGYLIAQIIISSTNSIRKINRNGVKKMCQNIFTIQQELANITTKRETDLDIARQYIELLYLTPDEILNMIHDQGSRFKEQDYVNALELLGRSEIGVNKDLLTIRRNKLSEILKENEDVLI